MPPILQKNCPLSVGIAGDEAVPVMANKLNFKPEEWATLLESTMVAGIAVSAAAPSGVWGTLKEFLANSSALDAAKRDPHSNELVAAVTADLETEGGQSKLQKALHRRFAEV